ncbi:glycoprotein 3-alpha-L-fucosyltransferase A [Hyalella azteca]|uniref:Fucosyltransferase n=1 Tax=Hyalella azteca TaxID=294128 RepID=A0A8B7NEY8_HYAAZ|nr:glycoprotein 3-alpha-L-fucosyltransferase A [Hyalella azteca]XP_047735994.1 glycoprotein 3-alpha-L-fucosyltransferase A [Hyalella azteca]XP_047735995.1 glycoprotein 3-alpha-L-fucosyltransferase A [Hyalella azteca]
MPRVSLRRAFFYFGVVACVSLLLVVVHSPSRSFFPVTGARRPSGFPERPVLLLGDDQQPEGALGTALDPRVYNEVPLSKEQPGAIVENPSKNEVDSSDFARLFIREEPTAAVPANYTPLLPHQRPWFMKGGQKLPEPSVLGHRKLLLWPDEDHGDRIPAQLMYKPPELPPMYADHPDVGGDVEKSQPALKKILMYNGMNSWGMKAGRGHFMKLKCPVDTCVLTGTRSELSSSDAVVFKDHFSDPHETRDPNQVWIMYMLECPLHTQHFSHGNVFNWTATYRHDSDLVAPYERYMYHDPVIRQMNQTVNYAAGKSKQVAWFVSNCGARNNRLQYAKELGRYIGVDIYGACGTKRCPRSSSTRCFDMLNRDYKFYLAFENSNCRDYITEKFFVNGLRGLRRRQG